MKSTDIEIRDETKMLASNRGDGLDSVELRNDGFDVLGRSHHLEESRSRLFQMAV
jgi:hypothetical protein